MPIDINSALKLTGINLTSKAAAAERLLDAQTYQDCAMDIKDRVIRNMRSAALATMRDAIDAAGLREAVDEAQVITADVSEVIKAAETGDTEDVISALIRIQQIGDLVERAKEIAYLQAKHAGVAPILDAINNIDRINPCDLIDGAIAPVLSKIPGATHEGWKPKLAPITVDHEQIERINKYNDTMYRINDVLNKEDAEAYPNHQREFGNMLSAVHRILDARHDQIRNGAPDTIKYSIERERKRGIAAGWTPEILKEYDNRVSVGTSILNSSQEEIVSFHSANKFAIGIAPGTVLGIGATTYSGPDKDFTTFLDLKPSERAPELIKYWEGKGYNIAKNEENLISRGIKPGTLSYSDAYNGAYGALVSDRTVASTRVPGGSILKLKGPDGLPYDPVGANPEGLYTVTDTGNSKLTYKKVDIFTSQPEAYHDLANVRVEVVSLGTKTNSQYERAQLAFT